MNDRTLTLAPPPSTNGTTPPPRPRPAVEPLLITMIDLSVMLAVSVRTVKRMTTAGEIPGITRIGKAVRYNLAIVKRWIVDGCPKPRRKG